jgi:hypothetical protein
MLMSLVQNSRYLVRQVWSRGGGTFYHSAVIKLSMIIAPKAEMFDDCDRVDVKTVEVH